MNFVGYALIQLPDLALVIYRCLKKVVREDVSPAVHRDNIELASPAASEGDADGNGDEEGANASSFREITTKKINKLEVSVCNLTQRFDEHSQRMEKTDEKLHKLEELMRTVIQKLDKNDVK